jgi:hypothetical protein
MKITKHYLKQVIKEELQKVTEKLGNLPEMPSEQDKLTPQQTNNFVKSIVTHNFKLEDIMQAIRLIPTLATSQHKTDARVNLKNRLFNTGYVELKGNLAANAIQQYFGSGEFMDALNMTTDFSGAEKAIQLVSTAITNITDKYKKFK